MKAGISSSEVGKRISLERGGAIEKRSRRSKKVEDGSCGYFCPQGLRRRGWGEIWEDAWISQLFVAESKVPEKVILKEEKFVVIHGFAGFNPWLTGSIAWGLW